MMTDLYIIGAMTAGFLGVYLLIMLLTTRRK